MLSRKDDEIVKLENTREALQRNLSQLDSDAGKIRDMLRSEQQAVSSAQKEKKDYVKHMRRVTDEMKGDYERKERELRKKIAELTRGVYSDEKEFERMRLELEKVSIKASKLEGKKVQVNLTFYSYSMSMF